MEVMGRVVILCVAFMLLSLLLTLPGSMLCLLFIVGLLLSKAIWRFITDQLQVRQQKVRGYAEFIHSVEDLAPSETVMRSVYRTLWQHAPFARRFPIRPGDFLTETYDIGRPGGLPMSELMQILSRRCHVSLSAKDWKANPPQTVRGLVRLISEQERGQRPGSPALLLRASSNPSVESSLLRPAQNVEKEAQDRLVRPTFEHPETQKDKLSNR